MNPKSAPIIETRTGRYLVESERMVCVVRIAVPIGGVDGSAYFEAQEDLVVEQITAWCEDAGGLAAVRIGWVTDSGKNTDFYGADKQTDAIYPVASTLFTDAGTPRNAQTLWNLIFKAGKTRRFLASDVAGTAPYNVELTLTLRRVRRIEAASAAAEAAA